MSEIEPPFKTCCFLECFRQFYRRETVLQVLAFDRNFSEFLTVSKTKNGTKTVGNRSIFTDSVAWTWCSDPRQLAIISLTVARETVRSAGARRLLHVAQLCAWRHCRSEVAFTDSALSCQMIIAVLRFPRRKISRRVRDQPFLRDALSWHDEITHDTPT